MINNWKSISLAKDDNIKEAMQKLDDSGLRITFVIDANDCLIGTVTDGDIRRGLLSGLGFEAPVSRVMKSNPICVLGDATKETIHDILRKASVLAVPVVDDNKKIIGLETIDSVDDGSHTDAAVVLMAGGFGKRLYPLTDNLPKPMLPLGEKPILEHIIEDFKSQGFKNFYITTHYKAEVIREYFNKNHLGVNIEYIIEDKPLGTAGSLFFLKEKIHSDFFVMNADLLVKTNFKNLLSFHQKHSEIATMCVKQHSYQVPFGVVSLENMGVVEIIEKPLYSHFISSGIYCFNKNIFEFCDQKKHIDMPTLLQNVIASHRKICAFPIHEYWVDVGCMDDYQKVNSDLK
jgi:dTDP-glucose pyrophosphorylase